LAWQPGPGEHQPLSAVVGVELLSQGAATGVGGIVRDILAMGVRSVAPTTGPDGVGGASILASAAFGGPGLASKRPSVQVGDPFLRAPAKCCLELYVGSPVVGIQDLGAVGVACATTELASAGHRWHAGPAGRCALAGR
jgi:phosphoribosylformylglycinamidine (FGAM) synthase-like enzyme